MLETITLSTTGELITVKRFIVDDKYSQTHEITLWSSDSVKFLVRVSKYLQHTNGKPRWSPAEIDGRGYDLLVSQVPRFVEILTHAARLALELDASYPAGSEVT